MPSFEEAAIGLVGLAFLTMLFGAIQTRWPQSYFSLTDITSYRISVSPFRYGLFRFGPVALASFVIGAVAVEMGERSGASVAVAIGGHVVLTSGRAMVSTLTAPPNDFAREARLIMYGVVAAIAAVAGLIGWRLSLVETLRKALPSSGDVSFSLWTAVFSGIAGAFLLNVSRGTVPTVAAVMKRSRSTLPDSIWGHIARESSRLGADLALVQSVALVENLQRPSWVRALERLKGRVFPRGTYGIMQVSAEEPISDETSVSVAIERFFKGTQGQVFIDNLDDLASSYNADETFRNLLRDFYYQLEQPSYRSEEELFESLEFAQTRIAMIASAVATAGGVIGYLLGRRRRRNFR